VGSEHFKADAVELHIVSFGLPIVRCLRNRARGSSAGA
jgi:hypothetical protein